MVTEEKQHRAKIKIRIRVDLHDLLPGYAWCVVGPGRLDTQCCFLILVFKGTTFPQRDAKGAGGEKSSPSPVISFSVCMVRTYYCMWKFKKRWNKLLYPSSLPGISIISGRDETATIILLILIRATHFWEMTRKAAFLVTGLREGLEAIAGSAFECAW